LLFVYAGILGLLATADCLTEEKRQGTLGLLFLTDLKGYDVVFGKLIATSLDSFYGMLAVVPVLAIPLLMGGVSQGELLRVVLMLVSLLFFSLSVGVWASALCRHTSRACAVSIVVVLTILFAWPLATQLRHNPVTDNRLAYLPSPVYGCVLAFDAKYKSGQQLDFWLNALITQLYAWFFLGMACWLAPRSWQDALEGNCSWWRFGKFSSSVRVELLALNPYLWRAARPRSKHIAVWVMLATVAAFWTWLGWFNRNLASFPWGSSHLFDPTVDLTCIVIAGFAIKVWVALESGRALGEDRRSGAMEFLLSTPMEPVEIVGGQQQSLWRQFAGPICILLAANAFFLMMEIRYMPRLGQGDDRLQAINAHGVIGFFLVLDSLALNAVGTRLGFRARKPIGAAAMALLWVLALPVLLCFVPGYLILTSPTLDGWSILVFWCVLGLGTDFFAIYTRENLLSEFRVLASEGHKRRSPKVSTLNNATPSLAETS
jgi:hypothetical protein